MNGAVLMPDWGAVSVSGLAMFALASVVWIVRKVILPFAKSRWGRDALRDLLDPKLEDQDASRIISQKQSTSALSGLLERIAKGVETSDTRGERERQQQWDILQRIREENVEEQRRQWGKIEKMEQEIHDLSVSVERIAASIESSVKQFAFSHQYLTQSLQRIEGKQDLILNGNRYGGYGGQFGPPSAPPIQPIR